MQRQADPAHDRPDAPEVRVTLGVDTYADVHVGVALDDLGRRVGTHTIPTTPAGYAELVAWVGSFGTLERIGLEGTGSYGAGLARWRRERGFTVLEVERPNRQTRRRRGKSDPLDAEAAARAVLAGTATGQPKAGDGPVEMVRALQVARRSAVRARTQAANQLHALVVTAPERLREQLRPLSLRQCVKTAAAFRPGATLATPTATTKLALRCVARRSQQLSAEIEVLDTQLTRLISHVAPALLAIKGVGTDTAAVLLAAAGDNPERLRSEAAFAHLCGVAPIPASSGKTARHRLNRGGNRDANRALHILAVRRLAWDPRTRAYAARHTAPGQDQAGAPQVIPVYFVKRPRAHRPRRRGGRS